MNASPDRLKHLRREMESIIRQFTLLPETHRERARNIIEQCTKSLEAAPSLDTPVYVHITGTDKSFKTSYLLDLFDNDELRQLFSVKIRTTSENTAVPCLVEPSEQVDALGVSQVSISTGEIIQDHLTPEEFNSLYDLSGGAEPDDYLIRIEIPAHATAMDLPVIEYPGIKEGADSTDRQIVLHRKFQENMMACLVKFPGILVACFQHKVFIPKGHPMDAILKKYGDALKTNFAHHKLPLVLSLQGESAVASYCGNTNVEQDIQSDFKSFTDFDAVVQLINPCNSEYPVHFIPPGPFVDGWIQRLSKYRNLDEIIEHIRHDGGISWSRQLLKNLCTTSYIREALDNIFLKPWITEATGLLARAIDTYHEIAGHDEVAEIRERMRRTIVDDAYQSLRQIFEDELSYTHENIIIDHPEFWISVFSNYLDQFFQEEKRSKAIAGAMWDRLFQRIDPEKKGFLGTQETDVPYIIMNMAELYVPNALMRGDHVLMEREMKEKNNVV